MVGPLNFYKVTKLFYTQNEIDRINKTIEVSKICAII